MLINDVEVHDAFTFFIFYLHIGCIVEGSVNLRQIQIDQNVSVCIFIIYTVNHKKRDILFFTVTSANLDRFLQFLYHFNREDILHATVVKFTTSP